MIRPHYKRRFGRGRRARGYQQLRAWGRIGNVVFLAATMARSTMLLRRSGWSIAGMTTSCASLFSNMRCPRNSIALAIVRRAVETGFASPCIICKTRPCRSGERVCGRVCREKERQTLQGYFDVLMPRHKSQTKTR